jgi:hypothetical protein
MRDATAAAVSRRKKGALPLDQALEYAEQIADALGSHQMPTSIRLAHRSTESGSGRTADC